MNPRLLEELWVDIVQAIVEEHKVPQTIIVVLGVLLCLTYFMFAAVYA